MYFFFRQISSKGPSREKITTIMLRLGITLTWYGKRSKLYQNGLCVRIIWTNYPTKPLTFTKTKGYFYNNDLGWQSTLLTTDFITPLLYYHLLYHAITVVSQVSNTLDHLKLGLWSYIYLYLILWLILFKNFEDLTKVENKSIGKLQWQLNFMYHPFNLLSISCTMMGSTETWYFRIHIAVKDTHILNKLKEISQFVKMLNPVFFGKLPISQYKLKRRVWLSQMLSILSFLLSVISFSKLIWSLISSHVYLIPDKRLYRKTAKTEVT